MYFELLDDDIPKSFEVTGATVFQQDGALDNIAQSVTKCLIEVWPGNNPNLNPTETAEGA